MSTPNPFGDSPFDPAPPAPAPFGSPLPQPVHRDEVNTLATLSVVFAFVFAPAGAIVGHLGLSQIARTRQRGRERALVGVTLSYVFITAAVVALVVWAALGTGSGQHTRRPTASLGSAPGTNAPPPLGPNRPPRNLRENALSHKPDVPRWSYSPQHGPIAVAGGDSRFVVVAASGEGILALDADSGKTLWVRPSHPDGLRLEDLGRQVNVNDCDVDRGDTAIACLIGNDETKSAVVFFLDAATGNQLGPSIPLTYTASDATYVSRAGNNFVVRIANEGFRGYRPDGTQIWHIDGATDSFTLYPDQGVILPETGSTKAYDTTTGHTLVNFVNGANASIAFASGFVIEDYDNQLHFYDFNGHQTATVDRGKFGLLEDSISFHSRRYEAEPSSGVYWPLAYSDTTHELRAFDATGRALWTTPVPNPDEYSKVALVSGSDNVCFVSHDIEGQGGGIGGKLEMRIQQCDVPISNPVLPGIEDLETVAGFDGQRALIEQAHVPGVSNWQFACVDISTGQHLWDITLNGSPVRVGNRTYVVAAIGSSIPQTQIQRWW